MEFKQTLTICVLMSACFNCLAMSERAVDVSGVEATLYYSEGKSEQPVVAIWGGSDGGDLVTKDPWVKASVRELVEYGYAALSITYFDPTGRSKEVPRELKRIPLEYFEPVFSWVKKQPDLMGDSLAIYGTSRGAELALLLASKYEIVDLVIAAVPSSYVWGSYSMFWVSEDWSAIIETDPCQAAWTWQGTDVPNICHGDQMDYKPWYKIIEKTDQVKDYTIPVETSTAAIMLTSGLHDNLWPSTEMSERIISRLNAKNYTYPYQHISYGTGHYVHSKSWQDVFSFIKLHYPVD